MSTERSYAITTAEARQQVKAIMVERNCTRREAWAMLQREDADAREAAKVGKLPA